MEIPFNYLLMVVLVTAVSVFYFSKHSVQRRIRFELTWWLEHDLVRFLDSFENRLEKLPKPSKRIVNGSCISFYCLLILFSVYKLTTSSTEFDRMFYLYFSIPFNSMFLGIFVFNVLKKKPSLQNKTSVSEVGKD